MRRLSSAKKKTVTFPLRQCLVSGVSQSQIGMVRFVIGPQGQVVPDVDAKLPGRGVWLGAYRGTIEIAITRGLFTRVARRSVYAPDDLVERVGILLIDRALAVVGLAKRAGVLTCGYEKIAAASRLEQVAFSVVGCDLSSKEREKVRRIVGHLPVIDLFEGAALGTAIGQKSVVCVAVKVGRMAEVLLSEANRLARYRGLIVYGNTFATHEKQSRNHNERERPQAVLVA